MVSSTRADGTPCPMATKKPLATQASSTARAAASIPPGSPASAPEMSTVGTEDTVPEVSQVRPRTKG